MPKRAALIPACFVFKYGLALWKSRTTSTTRVRFPLGLDGLARKLPVGPVARAIGELRMLLGDLAHESFFAIHDDPKSSTWPFRFGFVPEIAQDFQGPPAEMMRAVEVNVPRPSKQLLKDPLMGYRGLSV